MMFDTKVAILVLDELEIWQKLNVTAFLATGIAGGAPEAMGEPCLDAAGSRYAPLPGKLIVILAADRPTLLRARRQAQERGLDCATYVEARFSTGYDEANREAFLAKPAEEPALVGIGLRGPRKDVDKAPRERGCILRAARNMSGSTARARRGLPRDTLPGSLAARFHEAAGHRILAEQCIFDWQLGAFLGRHVASVLREVGSDITRADRIHDDRRVAKLLGELHGQHV